ncbi:unnamed protein product, partial [Mesorhabditis spiculigera]
MMKIKTLKPTNKMVINSIGLNLSTDPRDYLIHTGDTFVHVASMKQDDTLEKLTLGLSTVLPPGSEFMLKFSYTGKIRDSLRGLYKAPYLSETGEIRTIASTQFEPISARRVFPCFDEPDFKAAWKVTIIHPQGSTALANGIEEGEPIPLPDQPGWLKSTFRETILLSTYLVAFTVNDFVYLEGRTKSNVRVRLWSRKAIVGNLKYALSVGIKVLDYFEEYYGINFPMPKQDMIAIPNFEAGAMENMGLRNSLQEKELVTRIVTHELAHQWFGNLVTLKWWDDLWLNEGFGTHMEFLGAEYASGGHFHEASNFETEAVAKAFEMDATGNSHPLSFKITRGSDASNAFDHISYYKGAAFIRMLEKIIGTESLKKGLRAYLKKYAYSNAAAIDMLRVLGEHVPEDILGPDGARFNLPKFSIPWIQQMGFPLLSVRRIDENTVEIRQKRFKANPSQKDQAQYAENPLGYRWDIPIWYQVGGRPQRIVWLPFDKERITIHVSKRGGTLMINPEAIGYYRVNYDAELWGQIAEQLDKDPKAIPPLGRCRLIDDAFQLASAGELPYQTATRLTSYLDQETDLCPWKTALKQFLVIALNLGPEAADAGSAVKAYIGGKLNPLLEKVDLDSSNFMGDEDFAKSSLLRDITSVCAYMQLPECIKKMQDIFKEKFSTTCSANDLASSCSRVPIDVRGDIYCAAMIGGDEKLFQSFRDYFKTGVNERNYLILGMSCAKDPKLIDTLLTDALETRNGFQLGDTMLAFAMVGVRPFNSQLCTDFVLKHWPRIFERFGESILSLQTLIQYGVSVTTQEQLVTLEKFLADNRETTRDSLTKWNSEVEHGKKRIAWLSKNKEPLNINRKSGKTGEIGNPDFFIIVFSMLLEISEYEWQIVICGTIGLLGTAAGLHSLFVIRRCPFLIGIVEHYCLIHAATGVIVNFGHFGWAVPSAIWHIQYDFSFVNYFISTVIFASVFVAYVARIFLAINRWLSVAFYGKYYYHVEKAKTWCYVTLIGSSVIFNIPFLIPDCRPSVYTDPFIFFYAGEGGCGPIYSDISQIKFGYLEIGVTTIMEVSSLLLLNIQLKKLERGRSGTNSRSQLGWQLRFATQLVVFNAGEIASLALYTFFNQIAASVFELFILGTACWQLQWLVVSFIYIIFQSRGEKSTATPVTLVVATRNSSRALNAELEVLNYIVSFIIYACVPFSYFARMSMAFNRWIAVAFDGKYYSYLENARVVSYGLLVVVPMLFVIPLFIPGCRATLLTDPYIVFWTGEGDCGPIYIDIVQIKGGYFEIAVSMLFELWAMFLLGRRLRSFKQNYRGVNSRSQLGRQFRFASQLVAINTSEIAINVTYSIFTEYATSDLHMFLLATASWQLGAMIVCLIYIFFQRSGAQSRSGKVTLVATGQNSSKF